MATTNKSGFGIFEAHQSEFEEGQLHSDSHVHASRSFSSQNHPPLVIEANETIIGNLNEALLIPNKTSISANTSSTEKPVFRQQSNKDLHHSSQKKLGLSGKQLKKGKWKNKPNQKRPHQSLNYPHYGYQHLYPPAPPLYPPPFLQREFSEKTTNKLQSRSRHNYSNYPHFNPNPAHFGHPQPYFHPYGYEPKIGPAGRENHKQVQGEPFPDNFRKELIQLCSPSPKQNNNLKQKIEQFEKEKSDLALENDVEIKLAAFDKYFKDKEWKILMDILPDLQKNAHNSARRLFSLLKKSQGRRKIRKGMKVFEILILLNLSSVMDELIQLERKEKEEWKNKDKMKNILNQITRPLRISC